MKHNYDNIPQALKDSGLFCCWKYEERNGKPTKVPYNPKTGHRGKSNDRDTFTSFEDAVKVSGNYDGIGIGIFDNIAGIDIDHCFENGNFSEIATDICSHVLTYAELSPSGSGIHLYGIAPGFQYDKEQFYVNNQKKGVEVYVAGNTNKFLTVTGRRIDGNNHGLEDITEVLPKLCRRYMKRPGTDKTPQQQPGELRISDIDLFEKIRQSKQAEKFNSLWMGDISGYGSNSEADQALCNILAFWTAGDHNRIDGLFRQSGLFRDKWNRADYRNSTIKKAIEGCTEFYCPDNSTEKDQERQQPNQNKPGSDQQLAEKPKFKMISARELSKADLPEIFFPVHEIIPTGYTVIAAPPKSGKSWMMIDMGLKVAAGQQFLGFQTEKTGVLYLDLEENENRAKDRLNKASQGYIPQDFHYVFYNEKDFRNAVIGEGFVNVLDETLKDHPEIKIVVIDTLSKITGNKKRDETQYAADYRISSTLKTYADKKQLSIIGVTHVTKAKNEDDFLLNISGTNGHVGVADAAIVLLKNKRTDKDAKLCIDGRAVMQGMYKLHFDNSPDYPHWVYDGIFDERDQALMEQEEREREYMASSIRQAVLAIAKNNQEWTGRAYALIEKALDYGIGIEYGNAAVGKFLVKYASLFAAKDRVRVRVMTHGQGEARSSNEYRISEWQPAADGSYETMI